MEEKNTKQDAVNHDPLSAVALGRQLLMTDVNLTVVFGDFVVVTWPYMVFLLSSDYTDFLVSE